MFERTGLYAESWNVAWRKKKTGSILNDFVTPFQIVKNNFKYWAADPFLFQYDDDFYIFAELYDYVECRGGLGYCKWNGKTFGKWKKVISESYHLSYPFIFDKDGQIYIMPESGASQTLYLYRAVDFPDKWEKMNVLRKDVVYGDTSLFEWGGRTYALTYNVRDSKEYKLVLLDMKDEINDCTIDSMYPSEHLRPAGKMFCWEGRCLRPAQNCTNDYGEGLIFYEYNIDIKGSYTEDVVQGIMPKQLTFSKNILLDGMHTYNSMNGFEVIDIKTRRFNLLNFVFRIINKFRR